MVMNCITVMIQIMRIDMLPARIQSEPNAKHAVALTLLAFICSVCMIAISGCSAQQQSSSDASAEDKPLTSSEYMAQININVEELNDRLQSFNEAVSREDAITMRTQADNAFAVLDKMAAIEQPEELNDLRDQIIKGADQLKMALNSYVTLYTEISSSSSTAPFDYSTYADRIAEIQDQYNEGVQTLEDADKAATEL